MAGWSFANTDKCPNNVTCWEYILCSGDCPQGSMFGLRAPTGHRSPRDKKVC